MQPTISVFLKRPVPGRVKTRLAAAVGPDRAAAIYRLLVQETLGQIPPGPVGHPAADDAGAETHSRPQLPAAPAPHGAHAPVAALPTPAPRAARLVICHDPPDADSAAAIRDWLQALPGAAGANARRADFQPQASGDLGARLDAAVRQALADGSPAVAVVGTDCPWLRPHHFESAWRALESGADVVYGPARDGGYWLVAMRRPWPQAFAGIPWSAADTLRRSLDQLTAAGARLHLLETLSDIDDLGDWHRWTAAGSSMGE